MSPGSLALLCVLPEWRKDEDAAPEEYNKLRFWEKSSAVDPPNGSVLHWLYPAFIFLDAGYLAWETLATKSLQLSILTQAVALAALYLAERASQPGKALTESEG